MKCSICQLEIADGDQIAVKARRESGRVVRTFEHQLCLTLKFLGAENDAEVRRAVQAGLLFDSFTFMRDA